MTPNHATNSMCKISFEFDEHYLQNGEVSFSIFQRYAQDSNQNKMKLFIFQIDAKLISN